jgi:hypothetical protein
MITDKINTHVVLHLCETCEKDFIHATTVKKKDACRGHLRPSSSQKSPLFVIYCFHEWAKEKQKKVKN